MGDRHKAESEKDLWSKSQQSRYKMKGKQVDQGEVQSGGKGEDPPTPRGVGPLEGRKLSPTGELDEAASLNNQRTL